MATHDGHKLVYVYDRSVTQQACEITPDGDVLITGVLEVVEIDGDGVVFCDTCDVRVYAGEAGLSAVWEVV